LAAAVASAAASPSSFSSTYIAPIPPLLFTGDWCSESSFHGCADAADACAAETMRLLGFGGCDNGCSNI
jgi:hypothetical protein